MTELRQIAVVTDYDSLVAACRARAEALNVSRSTLDDVSGLQSGYAAKLLANPPIKTMGAVSLGPMLGALGMSIVLVEDAEQMARVASRMTERDTSQVRTMLTPVSMPRNMKLITRRNARKMVKKRMAKVPRWKRIAIARNAAKMRWMRVREARRAKRRRDHETAQS